MILVYGTPGDQEERPVSKLAANQDLTSFVRPEVLKHSQNYFYTDNTNS